MPAVSPAGITTLAHDDQERQQVGEQSSGMQQLRTLFQNMMKRLHAAHQGAHLAISLLQEPETQSFITTHADILDSSFRQVHMSDTMRHQLQRSDYIFSGIKTFHELNEAFPSLIDSNGNRKPFGQFLNDVQKIDNTYNRNYLRAEYNFCQQAANMAAKWELFQQDGDRYNLQYRTAGDDHVRPEHAALDRVTLPIDDPFWKEYYPPNGWNCRCTVVQVRKSKYPATPHDEAMQRGEAAVPADSPAGKIFRFNPGVEKKTFPDYNPYTISRCATCQVAKGAKVPAGSPAGITLAFLPTNSLCAACQYIRECYNDRTKSETKVLKTHYMHEMEPLLRVKQEMPAEEGGASIKVGFTKIGNEHLYSDTFGRSKVLRKEDLKTLDALLATATYIDNNILTEPHKYNIVQFYYYQAELHGQKIRLNVAKERRTSRGQIRVRYYLYSINDIKD